VDVRQTSAERSATPVHASSGAAPRPIRVPVVDVPVVDATVVDATVVDATVVDATDLADFVRCGH